MLFTLSNRYPDYREPPWSENQYKFSSYYWRLLAMRLFFVVVFENVIVSVTSLMRWVIPDIPQQLRQQMRQHAYLTNELILQQEYNRAKEISNENHFLAASRANLDGSQSNRSARTGYRGTNLDYARMSLHTADALTNRPRSESSYRTHYLNPDIHKRNSYAAPSRPAMSKAAISQQIMNKAASSLVLVDDFDLMQVADSNSLNETSNFYASQYLIESTSRDQLIRH